jgi:hypothetical protein
MSRRSCCCFVEAKLKEKRTRQELKEVKEEEKFLKDDRHGFCGL